MAVHDVAYIELYTSNKKSVVDYFVSSMGFTQAAESVGVDRSCALLRQGTVQMIVTTGPATWKFLSSHGDGIADIALTCDDVGRTVQSAVAAGATVTGTAQGNPTVSGFGGVTHTLLPCPDGPTAGPPSGRNWVVVPDVFSGSHTGRIQLLDHIAICLEGATLDKQGDYYREAFGLSRYSAEYVDVGEHAMDSVVMRSASGRVTFTLVAPDPRKGPGQLDSFLERNGGPGVQHLAFLVESIIPAVHEFRGRGVEFLNVPDTYYDSLDERLPGMQVEIDMLRSAQVLADRDEWGELLQLFSRSPYERNTLFYELIQRRGSRGFGSANIRALYEAVERDRLAAE
ncbi:4-hydroxyphenylpyruvate dioxygenase [Streptomyces sp. NL15-2K]|uniref:4-hydroxyphenylpyruvate dioxygenase n=1 Tax=Streptomyces sp. NL15-2K TaxID=376149 RepID=UPI000F55C3BB|nr:MULTISPECIES: 4-hydroxyphenylpyruvate dioxygenase [Actinomycetes]WKX06852.1 4-hydroxyphenylpyruvate dioxygenase [Kutzneria buriramensis]GCB43869.1 4-hydroxyphenylpyruvate dioxygenase [Streptomyces sp. NL15-2K]